MSDDRQPIRLSIEWGYKSQVKGSPVCEVCNKGMWWHGSTGGWGCPVSGGDPRCKSSLYRPKTDPEKVWHYSDRYPEREVN